MRNVISTCLLAIGILLILIGFITGLSVATEYGEFHFMTALYWWLSGIVSGFLFIGLSEIVHLLQKLLDKDRNIYGLMGRQAGQSAGSVTSNGVPREKTSDNGMENPDREPHALTKINGLTVILNGQRFKGAFWIDRSSLQVVQKGMFQSDEDARLVQTIPKESFISDYRYEKDYLILTFQDGRERQTLSFKTFTVNDYDRIIKLLELES